MSDVTTWFCHLCGFSGQLPTGTAHLCPHDGLASQRAEIDRLREERDLAAQDADRRSCQGGWRLAQERACEVIRLQGAIREALAALGHEGATNYERVQAAGLILNGCESS